MKKTVTDQMGRSVTFEFPPKRIISLVPSQTELLFDLGLDEEVVGITKFCVHPREKWKTKTRIGGTKKYHFDKIAELNPDLIIGNKEENEKSQIDELVEKYPVWMSDIKTLEDALGMILKIGEIINKEESSIDLKKKIKSAFDELKNNFDNNKKPKVAFFIWKNPYMVAASETFINEMIEAAGMLNVFANKKRYPEISLSELSVVKTDFIFLSSEPFPFEEKHITEFEKVCQVAVTKLVDGEMFSWYGSRMLKAGEYFTNLQKEINEL